jgi:thioredoxin 1
MSVQTFAQGRHAFERLQRESAKLIILEVNTPQCGSCDTLKSVLHQLATEHHSSFNLVEIDLAQEPELAIKLGVHSVPTVVLFKGDLLLETIIGLKPKQLYVETIQKWIYQTCHADLE